MGTLAISHESISHMPKGLQNSSWAKLSQVRMHRQHVLDTTQSGGNMVLSVKSVFCIQFIF